MRARKARLDLALALAQAIAMALIAFIPVSYSLAQPKAKAKDASNSSSILPVYLEGFSNAPEAASFAVLCPNVHVQNLSLISFVPMETRLMCGDPSPDEVGTPWATIPPNEAAYFARGFLQSRGYHDPEFIQDNGILFIRPGKQSRLTQFRIIGGPATWDPPRRRLIEGRELTPSLLNELEAWSLTQIKNEGYACATATSRADPATGELVVEVTPGEIKRITGERDTGDTGLREGVLDRYNAYHVGDVYRERLIELSRRRIIEDGFLQTIVLSARCHPEGVTIMRDVALGTSRLVRFAVGASTEEGAKALAVIRQTRIGSSASSAQARADLSYLNTTINHQSVDGNFRWYYSRNNVRSYLEPSITFAHTAELAFESDSVETRVLHGAGMELSEGRLEFTAGPNWLGELQSRSATGPSRSSTVFLELGGRWIEHDYEFFTTSPREGSYIGGVVQAAFRGFGARFTAQRVQLQGQKLWNIFRYDPPLLILAARFNASSVFSGDPNIAEEIPARFLTFIGGNTDLRGFSRGSLPRSGVGALSGATAGFEGRVHKVIMRRADFFTFIDAGALGGSYFRLENPIFMSPGFGFRWESPIGVFRLFAAERFALGEKANEEPYGKHWRIGFTYGEEF